MKGFDLIVFWGAWVLLIVALWNTPDSWEAWGLCAAGVMAVIGRRR